MSLTGWGLANHLTRAAAVIETRPLLISAWGYRTSGAAKDLVSMGVAGSADQNRRLNIATTTGLINAIERTTANAQAAATVAAPVDDWFHASGWFVSDVLREAELDGAALGTNATSITPGAGDVTRIGIRPDGGVPWDAAGALAEVTFWDGTGFTEPERRAIVDALAAGGNPLIMNADSGAAWLGRGVAYVLDQANSLVDLFGNGHDFTMVGTLTAFGSHPPVDAPTAVFEIRDIVTRAGVPQQGVTVRLINMTLDTLVGETVTDVAGEFVFTGLVETDVYHVLVEYESGGIQYQAISEPFVSPTVA